MKIELLLQQINLISTKYDLINQKTGGYFNIFEIAKITYDEVAICRVMYELLSPTGSHYQGNIYLKLFLEYVVKIEISQEELSTAEVYREYITVSGRRIDIAICVANRFIPIEVKIYASDQYNQCFDYYQEARNSNVYYLTRFGESPSKESVGKLTSIDEGYLEITNISFAEDILYWLEKCLEHKQTIRIAPIREVILQFEAVVRKFTNQMEDGKSMEIRDIMMATPENMRSSIEIERSLKYCKINMIEKLFRAIETQVDKNKLNNEYDYEYNGAKKVNNFYNHKNSTCPGISYLYKSKVKNDTDIWVRIEIDYKIFVGYCIAVNGKWKKVNLSEDEITKAINGRELCIDGWWGYWEYIPNDQESISPDFKTCNNAFVDLFDQKKFEVFTQQCAKRIKELLEG